MIKDFNGNIILDEEEKYQWQLAIDTIPVFNVFNNLSPINKIKKLYEVIDLNIENSGLKKITACGEGCSFCCHDKINITEDEAVYIKSHNPSYNVERSQVQKDRDFWSLSFKNKACIFLKDNKCSIYNIRPYICRLHNVSKVNNYTGKLTIPEEDCLIENGKSKGVNNEIKTILVMAGSIWLGTQSPYNNINTYFT